MLLSNVGNDYKQQCIKWLQGGSPPRKTKTMDEMFYYGRVYLVKRNPQLFDLDQQVSKLQNDEVLIPPARLSWCDLR